MPDDAIAIDTSAPELDTAPLDTGAPDAGAPSEDPATPGTAEPGQDGTPEGQQPAAPKEYEPAIVGNRLSKSAWQVLGNIKKENPRLASEIRAALFDAHNLREQLPGGLKEINELRTQLDEMGGIDAIQRSREELNYFNDLDSQFTAGDPRFVQAMLDTPEGQAGFVKLAPTMLEKYREMAPEHHDAYVARQHFSSMQDADMRNTLLRMQDIIGYVAGAKNIESLPELAQKLTEQWASIGKYYNTVAEAASKKPDLPKVNAPTADPNSDRDRQLTEREQNVVRTEWRGAANSERMKIFSAEWARLTKDRRLTDTQAAAVKELYASRLGKALASIPNFSQTAQRFFVNGDKEGFLRHSATAFKQQIPKQLRAAMDAIVSGKAQAAAAAPAARAASPAAPSTQAGAKPAEGFTWVNAPPDKTKIDFRITRPDMIRQGKAVLSDGRKVQWRRA